MRKTQLLVLTVVTLAMAGPALADLAAPVQVRLASGFAEAKAGEALAGTLEITCLADGRLDGFDLAGDGWTVERFAPDARAVTKGDVVTVAFAARPTDPSRQLVFSCRLGGRPLRYGMDFSITNQKRAARLQPVVPLPAGRGPMIVASDIERANRVLAGDPPAPPADDRRAITVHGRFGYVRGDGVVMGGHTVRVTVYDYDPTGGDDYLGQGSTDGHGYYSITVDSEPSGETQPDIYVLFELINGRVEVIEPTSGARWGWVSSTQLNVTGSDVDLGALGPADATDVSAVHVHTNVSRAWVFDEVLGYDLPAITCHWPSANWTSYWNRVMYIFEDHAWAEGVMAHEYGHFFDDEFSGIEPFDYCNGICDESETECGHCAWCPENEVVAWLEGWANYHGVSYSRWYEGAWGVAPMEPLDFEDLYGCGDLPLDQVQTEGFCTALMQDIEDDAQDSHGLWGDWTDALALGREEIFDVCVQVNPDSPWGIIHGLKELYPATAYDLWETSANCGLNPDNHTPGQVSSLSSVSHQVGVPSADPTISFSWNPATDDFSGIAGYGITVAAVHGLPTPTQDLGDVTGYTTEPLAPGSYYFAIRAVDRAGRWSWEYSHCGPYIVAEPEPSDLTWVQAATWDYPLVPRSTTGATFNVARVTATLPGDGDTYWNLRGVNQGASPTSSGFYGYLNVDGAVRHFAYWNPVGAGDPYHAVNWGPVEISGGRHSFTCRHDGSDQIAESDETNNVWGTQFVWTPRELDPGIAVMRFAPFGATSGWDDVTHGSRWYNCDGLRVPAASSGYWNAAAIWAVNPNDDFDCRKHAPSTGAQNGFAASDVASLRGAGLLDAVVVNRRNVPGDWDCGVINLDGASGKYRALHATSWALTFGDSLAIGLPAGHPLLLREVYVDAAHVGPVMVDIVIDPAQGPVRVLWLDADYEHGSLSSGFTASVGSDASGRAHLETTVTSAGYHAILVYREPTIGLPAMTLVCEIGTPPPDLAPWARAGWHSPLVPRPAADGTPTTVPLPDSLYCSPGATYLNLAFENLGPTPAGFPISVQRDGVQISTLAWPQQPGGAQVAYNATSAQYLTGGRHILAMELDQANTIEEIDESNNVWGEPWVWGPTSVTPGTTVSRSAPPALTGGWDDVTSGEALWFNCDGLRLSAPGHSWWAALAVMPAMAFDDLDVRLHARGTGAKSGFTTNLGRSSWSTGYSDYVLVNYHEVLRASYDVGVLNMSGSTASYRAHAASSTTLTGHTGVFGPYSLAANQILAIYQAELPAGHYRLNLVNDSGGADLGLSLHRNDAAFQTKSSALSHSWTAPAGANESLSFDITTASWYAFAVWKSESTDLAAAATFRLELHANATPVDDVLPAATRLLGARPNPFNPRTDVVFELARPGRVDLDLFDVQGRHVRTLVDADLPAGRHAPTWDGRDDAARDVAAGVYFARLVTTATVEMVKLVLVR